MVRKGSGGLILIILVVAIAGAYIYTEDPDAFRNLDAENIDLSGLQLPSGGQDYCNIATTHIRAAANGDGEKSNNVLTSFDDTTVDKSQTDTNQEFFVSHYSRVDTSTIKCEGVEDITDRKAGQAIKNNLGPNSKVDATIDRVKFVKIYYEQTARGDPETTDEVSAGYSILEFDTGDYILYPVQMPRSVLEQ